MGEGYCILVICQCTRKVRLRMGQPHQLLASKVLIAWVGVCSDVIVTHITITYPARGSSFHSPAYSSLVSSRICPPKGPRFPALGRRGHWA